MIINYIRKNPFAVHGKWVRKITALNRSVNASPPSANQPARCGGLRKPPER